MRYLVSLIILTVVSSGAYASKTVSGVVAVSTGPMKAVAQSVDRNLTAGDDVFMNDEVETGEKTRAQVLLRDESVFSMAPSSRIVFDEFVYDPTVGEGSLQASLVKGGLRFVSGQLSNKQPENIKIKAGKATVGIRGTEIMAQRSEQGSTFVLLSGEMEISTDSGTQLINRPGFGIDVSGEGMLGPVRPVPLAEINAILAPPSEKEESQAKDEEAGSVENEEGEEENASASDDESDDAVEEASADAETETASADTETETESGAGNANDGDADGQDSAAADVAPEKIEGGSADESAFDAALTASVGSSDSGNSETSIANLGELGSAISGDTPEASLEVSTVEVAETEPTVEINITEAVVASVVDSLAEDEQKEKADEVIAAIIDQEPAVPETPEVNITLTLENVDTLTANPYFSSSASLLVRSTSYFKEDAPGQFNVTHALLSEKFPDSFDDNGPINHTARQTSDVDLSSYDAIFIYLGTNDASHNFSSAEVTAYRGFIHDDSKKVLTIGRQEQDMGTINSVMPIFHNGSDGYQYTGSTSSNNQSQDLSSVDGSTSELLLGVTSFEQYNDSSGFQRVSFSQDLVADNSDTPVPASNGLLTNSFDDYPALDFGDKGAVFFGRWSCGANSSMNGNLGASIDANFVDNGREQFCRNLISSIAPDDSLIDVEVGSLSVSGDAQTANYRLVSGGGENFKIIGNKIILDKSANLQAGSYDLNIGVTPQGAEEVERTISISVLDGAAEKRIIAARDRYNVGDSVSFPTENLVSHKGSLEDISWVSITSDSGGGQPVDTGIITLHYRVSENGHTYDRYHDIEVVHDCTSDHCDAFATSMDTEGELAFNHDFDESNRSTWGSFFDRFTTGTVRMQKGYSISSSASYDESGNQPYLDVLNADYSHNLDVNFGTEMGELNTQGTFDGIVNSSNEAANFDLSWNFSFTDNASPCDASGSCYLKVSEADSTSVLHNMQTSEFSTENFPGVGIMNMALPNGKHSILVRSNLASEHSDGCDSSSRCRLHETDYQPMTPQ